MTFLEYIPTNKLSPESFHLGTERLSLQLISEDHLSELYNLMANPAITTFLAWSPHESRETTLSVIRSLISAREKDSGVTWIISHANKICGIVSLIDVKRRHRLWLINRAELSYWLDPSFQKKGLMTEACNVVLNFSFKTLRFHKIIVAHAKKNIVSETLVKRLGFKKTGTEIEAFRKDKVWHDLIHYQLLRSQWRKGEDVNA